MSKKTVREIVAAAGLLGLILVAATAAYYLVNNDLSLNVKVMGGVGLVCLGVYVWANPRQVADALTGNRARYSSNTLAAVVAFIAIIGLVNFIVARSSPSWDLTENKTFTLSDQTIKAVADLKSPVHVTGFISGGNYGREQSEDILKQLAAKTDKLTYEFVDPDLNPTKAIQLQAADGSLIFQSGNKRQEVTGYEESDFTKALLSLNSDKQRKVGFLTGHGERAIDRTGADGYSYAKQVLESDNYVVAPLDFSSGVTATDGVDVIVVADPQTQLLDEEKQKLNEFLAQGGRVLFLTDAHTKVSIDEFLKPYGGVTSAEGVVVDPGASINDAAFVAVQRYQNHAITKDMRARTYFPYTTSLIVPKTPSPVSTVSVLAESSDRSWLETDLKVARFDEGSDTPGPLALAVAIDTNPIKEGDLAKKTRIVVIGDADFASNAFIQNGANPDFFANSVNWLSESEDMISVRPKPSDDRSVILTTTQKNGIMLSTIILFPLGILAAGGMVWWKRR